MSAASAWLIPALMCLVMVVALVSCCLDRRAQPPARQHVAGAHPVRRAPAVRCPVCYRPVRYENHPGGRADALTLHAAYECVPAMSLRKHVT